MALDDYYDYGSGTSSNVNPDDYYDYSSGAGSGGGNSAQTYTLYDGTTTTDANDPNIDWSGNTAVRTPMVDTNGTPIAGGWVTKLADGSTKYEDPDGSVYYKNANNTYSITGAGGQTLTYDPAKGNFVDASGKPLSSSVSGLFSKGLDAIKGAFTKADGSTDWGKALSLLGGLSAASKSNTTTVPAGYQGKVPTYIAQRPMLTAPPMTMPDGGLRRPGSGGINYGGNVAYTNAATGNAVGTPQITSLEDLKKAALSNPYSQPGMAAGGIASLSSNYARGGLASNGFVIPADVVSHFGNGSTNAGLRLLEEKLGASPIHGKGDGMSDSIKTHIDGKQEARVADGEAFVSPERVRQIGNGDSEKGAKKLYAMLDQIRKARTGNSNQGKEINPNKFMPGGSVGYASGGIARFADGGVAPSAAASAANSGVTGTESNLSNWAGEYVTDLLGKGQALAEAPYQAYTGPLTAGASDLQNKVFTGLQNTNFPGNFGQSFTNTTAPTIGADGQPVGGSGIASTYMNPYLQNVLTPQLAELRRTAEINNLSSLGSLTKSGAFGGGRQAIMESEAGRNLLNEQNKAIGQGYSDAFNKGRDQFNTEQTQAKSLADLMATQGKTQRDIEAEGIAADKTQFEEARVNPYKMLQFQQSLLGGMPLSAQTYDTAPTSDYAQFAAGFKSINDALAKLGVSTAPTAAPTTAAPKTAAPTTAAPKTAAPKTAAP